MYKRQVEVIAPAAAFIDTVLTAAVGRGAAAVGAVKQLTVGNLRILDGAVIVQRFDHPFGIADQPVSYTHLDVYKRQENDDSLSESAL